MQMLPDELPLSSHLSWNSEVMDLWLSFRKKSEQKKRQEFVADLACTTHIGNIRTGNEDNFFFDGHLMQREHESSGEIYSCTKKLSDVVKVALFDGMGGESSGETASYIAAKTFAEYVEKNGKAWTEEALKTLFLALNRAVCSEMERKKITQMGTTAIVAEFAYENAWIANLGDSPVYLFREGMLTQEAQMHTNEALLKECGITNRKPGLTQFLGIPEAEFQIEPSQKRFVLQDKDIWLLCSDGLTDMVSEQEIVQCLDEELTVSEKVGKLVKLALQNGGKDNITIILCQISNSSEEA